MVANKSKRYFSVILTLCDFVLVVNTLVRKSSDLPEFNETHNAAMFSSMCETLLYRYVTPSFAVHFFRVNAGENWYFFANSPLCF